MGTGVFRQFADKHPAFSVSSLRWLRYGADGIRRYRGDREEVIDANGFADAFVKVGGRCLVDEGEFFAVIGRQKNPSLAQP